MSNSASRNNGKIQTLLDENLTHHTQGLPTPLNYGSHVWLKKSVDNDTSFLAKVDVIDYSLLVGFQNADQKGRFHSIFLFCSNFWEQHSASLQTPTNLFTREGLCMSESSITSTSNPKPFLFFSSKESVSSLHCAVLLLFVQQVQFRKKDRIDLQIYSGVS